MPARRHNSLADAIGDACQRQGLTQNQLAKKLGTNSGNLANAKAGRATLAFPILERLAAMVDDEAGHLWTLVQLARLPHRNPRNRKR